MHTVQFQTHQSGSGITHPSLPKNLTKRYSLAPKLCCRTRSDSSRFRLQEDLPKTTHTVLPLSIRVEALGCIFRRRASRYNSADLQSLSCATKRLRSTSFRLYDEEVRANFFRIAMLYLRIRTVAQRRCFDLCTHRIVLVCRLHTRRDAHATKLTPRIHENCACSAYRCGSTRRRQCTHDLPQ